MKFYLTVLEFVMCAEGHSKYLEQVKFYTHVGSILYGGNFIEE